ncbi:MAG: alpha/beta hydrolase [Desulfobacteraceae bacterium]
MSKTILMIHGMWGGSWCWDRFKGYFENRGYTCIAPDLRHHDITPKDPPPPGLGTTSLLDYAEDLEQIIQKLDEKPVVFGHSMGGLLAQILAGRGLAEAAVLITPAPPAGVVAVTWSMVKSFSEILLTWKFWKRPHRISFKTAEYAVLNRLPAADRKYVYSKMVWESGRAAAEICLWMLGVRGAQVDAASLTCPVLVVSGSEDHITAGKVGRKIAARYKPSAAFLELEGYDHWMLDGPGWEKPAVCIYNWLNSCDPGFKTSDP